MSEPVSPEAAQQAVQNQLADQGADLAPPPVQVPVGGQASVVDVEALLARLQALEAGVAAAQAAADEAKAAAEPKPPSLADLAVNVADAAARHAFQVIVEELDAVKQHIGL